MKDVIVVGAGIVGGTVAEAFRLRGASVLNLDDQRPLSGSRPSGGHLKPSWFGDMKKAAYEPAMQLLADQWGLIEEPFRIWPTPAYATVYRVDMDAFYLYVQATRTIGRVMSIRTDGTYPVVTYEENGITEELPCRFLVVATGAWAAELCPDLDITAKRGVSFRINGTIPEPLIRPWAPYKQIVAHQQTEGLVWVGDGTALLDKNWPAMQVQKSLNRCRGALGLEGPAMSRQGLRPYVECPKGEPCLLKQLGPRAWLATGAGKSGTIAAGWVARRLVDQLC